MEPIVNDPANINYTVAICMLTYNHENYIEQAIQGVLMQRCNFNYLLVIGDDASKDNTVSIAKKYELNHPEKIKVFDHKENIGMMPNFIFVLDKCQAEFVSICEGDDYWTDPYKLQKQVDFLQAHPQYAIAAHNCNMYFEDTKESIPFHQKPVKETLTIRDFIFGNYINTLSILYRKKFETLPQWMLQSKLGDWPLILILTQQGAVHFDNTIQGVYRIHATGVHQNASNWNLQKRLSSYENALFVLDNLKETLVAIAPNEYAISYANYALDKSLALLKLKHFGPFIKSFLFAVFNYPIGSFIAIKERFILRKPIRNIYK